MADKNKNEALVKALLNPTAPKIDNSKMANQLKGFPQDMRKWTELQKAQYNAQPSVQKQKYDMQKAGNAGVGEGLLTINSFMPVTGDIQSGILAANDLKQGNYGSAALNGLGLLPFIPSMAGMIASKGDKVADAIRPLTQYELAQQVAQKNAVEMLGLPPNNTAMDRARAMGFDTPAYHGTARIGKGDAIQAFNFEKGGFGSGNRDGRLGIFSSDNPDVANSFAEFVGKYEYPQVMPLMLKQGNAWKPEKYNEISDTLDHFTKFQRNETYGGKKLRMYGDVVDAKAARDAILGEFDSIALKNTLVDSPDGITPINQFVSLKPENIRSRFAAFDPARANEADILGSITPEMLGLLAVGSGAGVGYAYNKKEKKTK